MGKKHRPRLSIESGKEFTVLKDVSVAKTLGEIIITGEIFIIRCQ